MVTEAEELAAVRAQLPPGYEIDPPGAPGGPWTWTAPGGDAGAEWTSGEALDEARHHHAATTRRARDLDEED